MCVRSNIYDTTIHVNSDHHAGDVTLVGESFWSMRKGLKLILGGLLVTILAMLLLIPNNAKILQSNNNSQNRFKKDLSKTPINACTSSACVSRSTHMISAMDLSIDPCQDFYKYACGRWNRGLNSNMSVTTKNTSRNSTWDQVKAENNIKIKNILERPDEFFKTKSEKLAQSYYQSCVKIEKEQSYTDAQSRKALLRILDLIGGWPALGEILNRSYLKMNWDFQEAFETVHNVLKVDGFLYWSVELFPPKVSTITNFTTTVPPTVPTTFHKKEPRRRMIKVYPRYDSTLDSFESLLTFEKIEMQVLEIAGYLLDQNSSTFINRDRLLLDEVVKDIKEIEMRIIEKFPIFAYNEYITIADLNTLAPFIVPVFIRSIFYDKYARYMSKLSPQRLIAYMMRLVYSFTRLPNSQEYGSKIDGKFSRISIPISGGPNNVSLINWTTFFQSAFRPLNISITPSRIVMVNSLSYLKQLYFIINELLTTDKGQRKLRNYLSWRVTHSYYEKLRNRWDVNEKDKKINTDCIADTIDRMDYAISAMFLRNGLDDIELKKHLAETMTKSIKEAFNENLNHLYWLDNETRINIKEKVDDMDSLIGYPEFILNPTELDTFYENLDINSSEYLMNYVRLEEFLFRKILFKLDQPIDEADSWENSPISTYASYNSNINQIFLPSGQLQQPFFDVTYPHAVNFGSIGFIIAHELGHGFHTNDEKYYLYNGNFQWFEKKEIFKYIKKSSDCLIRQYSNFSTFKDGQDPIDGKQTLDENFADNLGLRTAFNAFINRKNSQQEDFSITFPGLTLTQQQLFFLSFAQVFCSNDDLAIAVSNDDRHSPKRYRTIGTLANMPEFANAFKCPTGTLMNPKEKCRIF